MTHHPLRNKKILLSVTGSIAAYKAVILCRLLIKTGADVKVLMTTSAQDFVGPLTFSTLSGHEVLSDVSSSEGWNNHVELGLWADYMIIAPCTANTLAKLANGFCDNIISAAYLSARCPVCIAPAMDVDMWHHPSTKRNLEQIEKYGTEVIPVGHGFLASGLEGEGRMAEPEDIVEWLTKKMNESPLPLQGKKALVTAGPTYEAIDPVRFLGNWSSGRMGIALAEALASRGCETHLVLGPTHLRPENKAVMVHHVKSAADMYNQCVELWDNMDIGIMAAAVSDYRPAETHSEKLKKSDQEFVLKLKRTQDIALSLGSTKTQHQRLIGFALETNNGKENALKKLERKDFDFIVLNNMKNEGAGFQFETNKVTILESDGRVTDYPLKSKKEVAKDIVDMICEKYKTTHD